MLLNTASSLAAQLVAVIYGFVIPRLILEQFGSEVNGLTQSIKQFLTIISFLDLGVGQVIRSALYGPLEKKDSAQISTVMASGRKFYNKLIKGMVVYVAVLTVAYPLLANQNFGWIYTATLIMAMSISSFAQFFFSILNNQLLQADQRGYILYTSQIVANIVNAVLCVILMRLGGSIQGVQLLTSLVFLLKALFVEFYVRRHYQLDRKIRYTGEPLKQKWNGVAQHISAVVLDGTDIIVLTLFSTLANVSVYSVYYMVISSIQQLYQSAAAGVQAAAGSLWARGDRNSQEKMFHTAQMCLHYVTVFLFCCIGLLIVPFIRVYTNGFVDADYIQPVFAAVLTVAYGIRCLRTPYNIWILAAGDYKRTQRCHIIAAALNLTISLIAVLLWGLLGVAIGTLIAMVYQTTWMAVYNIKHLLKMPWWNVAKQFAVDFLTAGAICLVSSFVKLAAVSYWGWFLMALQVGLIAAVIVFLSAITFYRKQTLQMLKMVPGKR